MPLSMGAGWLWHLIARAIGHAFEADFNRKNTSIFSDQLNKKVCNEHINVVDDGTILSTGARSISMTRVWTDKKPISYGRES